MATIKTGILLKTKGSVGGVNFYNRTGTQCLRNKPQRSESYISSPAQRYQQSVFKLVADYSKSSASVVDLIKGGWGMKKAGKGRTAYNNFSGEVLRKLSRDELGAKVDQATYEANVAAFEANPGGWMHKNVPLTMSKFPSIGAVGVFGASDTANSQPATLTVEEDVFNEWLQRHARQYGVVGSPEDVKAIIGGAALGSTGTEWYIEVTPTKTGTQYTFELPATFDESADSYDLAFAFYPTASGAFGAPEYPAVSQYARVSL